MYQALRLPHAAALQFTLVATLILLLAAPAFAADIPSVSDSELEAALQLAGSNRPQLQAALDYCIQKPFAMQAMRFVVGNLPTADLGSVSSQQLIDNYELALAARQDHAYARSYDDATWAHYVLPPRVSQEPLCDWRRVFIERCAEAVKDSATLEDAAVIINKLTGGMCRFEQTQTRDQNAVATLTSGYGRCEELVIVYVCACRAVGIPARQAYTPWWATQDNNHAWAEIFGTDNRWHFTGGCEPAPTMDSGWFGDASKNAALIVSICFGLPDALPEGGKNADGTRSNVLDYLSAPGARYCRINSTGFYRQTGWLSVQIPAALNALSKPLPEGQKNHLTVSIFNYGALRSIARIELDSAGRASIELGPGNYVLSTDVLGEERLAYATVSPSAETQIVWDEALLPPDSFILQFPHDPE